MAVYRVQMGFAYDSALPRDVMTINPHFFGDNPQALADALKSNLLAYTPVGPSTTFSVKVYDAQKAPPSFPLAQATNGTSFTSGATPREICLCLSYYSTWNRPRYRGRMYLPAMWMGGSIGIRPTTTQRANALAFKTVLTTGLPASHNWVVWSAMNQQSNGVTNIWCDDEWDTIRSRGMKGTTRTLGTVP